MESDDGRRPARGVVVTLLDDGEGTFRLIMDDVSSSGGRRETSWRFESFYTQGRLDAAEVRSMQVQEDELMGIGVMLMARLLGPGDADASEPPGYFVERDPGS